MILNSARSNTGVQMSTRNSCKTLKCPQCNWHYKYQETLEIHMREKHPDGESACGYCLAGKYKEPIFQTLFVGFYAKMILECIPTDILVYSLTDRYDLSSVMLPIVQTA